ELFCAAAIWTKRRKRTDVCRMCYERTRGRSGSCTRCGRWAWRWPDAISSILIKTEADRSGQGVALAESSGIGVGAVDVADGAGVGDGVGVGLGGAPEIFVNSSSSRRFSSA